MGMLGDRWLGMGGVARMMKHNHGTPFCKLVNHDSVLRATAVDARSGIVSDGSFCGWSVIRPNPCCIAEPFPSTTNRKGRKGCCSFLDKGRTLSCQKRR